MKRVLCIVLTLAAVFSFVACGGKAEQELSVEWEYITGLPEGFPKLCDKVTESTESFTADSNVIAIRWNILEEASYNDYTAKIEEWAGVKFGDAKDGAKSLVFMQGDEKLTVKATYNADADGFKSDDGSYNCQAVIEVYSAATHASKYTPVKWDYLFPLPEDFPKLCDAVTTVDEVYGDSENSFAMYWNILDKEDFDSYVSKIEAWAGAKFGESAPDGTRTLEGNGVTVKAAYNGKGTGKYLQSNKYDSQARIEVITPAK